MDTPHYIIFASAASAPEIIKFEILEEEFLLIIKIYLVCLKYTPMYRRFLSNNGFPTMHIYMTSVALPLHKPTTPGSWVIYKFLRRFLPWSSILLTYLFLIYSTILLKTFGQSHFQQTTVWILSKEISLILIRLIYTKG